MPRHSLRPIARSRAPVAGPSTHPDLLTDPTIWSRMDRAQVLGTPAQGHQGCINALSWSDDGSTLLSGSDDKRICIWATDSDSSNTTSPHPMKLVETISTGHRANIFSAKYLPNTSTPTIVSCAGDRQVRVFEVERLGRMEGASSMSGRPELDGLEGPGVRVLRCHTDRTKRIATENSPFLFLTVSEDGTVRQHDLRRPHTCRAECPEALFRAPRDVDLYSLSVSTVTPHMFAVAGRTDCAYVCDRRMLERQTPSWGPRAKQSGQVHCVRRLGLSNDDWESAGVRQSGPYAEPRHITCVKMSPDKADEVICAFAQHSTSLFSTFDSPESASMRHKSRSPSTSPRVRAAPTSTTASPPHTQGALPSEPERAGALGKRRQSDRSSVRPNPTTPVRRRIAEEEEPAPEEMVLAEDYENEADWAAAWLQRYDVDNEQSPRAYSDDEEEERYRMIHGDYEYDPYLDEPVLDLEDLESDEDGSHVSYTEEDIARFRRNIEEQDSDVDLRELLGLNQDDDEHDDEHDDDEDDDFDEDDEFDWESGDERVDEDDLEIVQYGLMDEERWPLHSAFDDVDIIRPRRSFMGAKNMETVKDCNFLGSRSDKICSGSDDGNFFVWDKETGRLEGIWEGDGHVVNVMEQHPTLPVVAVSGIDNTVKLFAPLSQPPPRSFSRLHLKDSILRANTDRAYSRPLPDFGNASVLELLRARGIQARFMGGAGDEEGEQECTTQ